MQVKEADSRLTISANRRTATSCSSIEGVEDGVQPKLELVMSVVEMNPVLPEAASTVDFEKALTGEAVEKEEQLQDQSEDDCGGEANIDRCFTTEDVEVGGHDDLETEDDRNSWSDLPEDLMSRVLARLPIPRLLQVRAVCRQWKCLTLSAGFRELCEELAVQEPYYPLILFRGNQGMEGANVLDQNRSEQDMDTGFRCTVGYDHTVKKWQKLPPLDFLPRKARIPLAASGGLFCFRGDASLYMCNPVTRTWKELPLLAHKWPPYVSVHILVDEVLKCYKVIVAGKIRHNFLTEGFRSNAIYDSETSAWRVVDAQPPKVFSYGRTAAMCRGVIYCEAICYSGMLGVIGYDITREIWLDALHEISSDDLGDYQLSEVIECGGSIYMVVARGYGGVVTMVYVLKLEKSKGSQQQSEVQRKEDESVYEVSNKDSKDAWRKVTDLPTEFLECLREVWFGVDNSDVVCVAHGTKICIAAGMSLLLVYNVVTDSWSNVPSLSEVLGQAENWPNAELAHFPVELTLSSLI